MIGYSYGPIGERCATDSFNVADFMELSLNRSCSCIYRDLLFYSYIVLLRMCCIMLLLMRYVTRMLRYAALMSCYVMFTTRNTL
jgi:hypothetical protein